MYNSSTQEVYNIDFLNRRQINSDNQGFSRRPISITSKKTNSHSEYPILHQEQYNLQTSKFELLEIPYLQNSSTYEAVNSKPKDRVTQWFPSLLNLQPQETRNLKML